MLYRHFASLRSRKYSRRAVLALGVAALASIASPAVAQPACAPRDQLVPWLADRHNERQTAFGLSEGGSLVELFTSPSRLTWTLLVTDPQGKSCIVAAGTMWQPTGPLAGRAVAAPATTW